MTKLRVLKVSEEVTEIKVGGSYDINAYWKKSLTEIEMFDNPETCDFVSLLGTAFYPVCIRPIILSSF